MPGAGRWLRLARSFVGEIRHDVDDLVPVRGDGVDLLERTSQAGTEQRLERGAHAHSNGSILRKDAQENVVFAEAIEGRKELS